MNLEKAKAWLVRSFPRQGDEGEYCMILGGKPVLKSGVWTAPDAIASWSSLIVPEELIEYSRPDLRLDPGGGPVEVRPDGGLLTDLATLEMQYHEAEIAIGELDAELKRVKSVRDMLLAALDALYDPEAGCWCHLRPGKCNNCLARDTLAEVKGEQ